MTSRSTTARPTSKAPSLRLERELMRGGCVQVAGMDEVGRGALAGPVSVGVVVVTLDHRSAPCGLRDSKLLTPAHREDLVPRIQHWASAGWGVGHASNDEIDTIGIMAALRLAGRRALAQLPTVPDLVLLDGNYDWLTEPAHEGLLGLLDEQPPPAVRTLIKADMTCSSVAAASVLAKVARDRLMVAASSEHPAYGWDGNKGYAAADHLDALAVYGPCELHRRSWHLPERRTPAQGAECRDDGAHPVTATTMEI